ncbi:MAG: hypothetical protein N2Z21_04350 [Candidatus Sumerlaeaceae bacterium]|nr:hypothetical protein [Candidatus Sumerlaeaceae bacterium]
MAERMHESRPAAKPWRPVPERRRELDELRAELGADLPEDLLAHLEDLQAVADAGVDFDDPQAVEAALRRLEYERIKREFRPQVPLYGIRVGEEMAKDRESKHTPPPGDSKPRERRRRSYQDDPRYRAFYERLKNRHQQESSKYDEPPEFSSLEELEQTGWDGTPRPWEHKRKSPAQPSQPKAAPPPSYVPPPAHQQEELVPGIIMRFDDGSIAIYKDAVSGKDYALFYFLEPNGVLVPQGIFLDQYESQRIGQLPPDLFEAMIRMRRWDRDAVIYHLDRFEFAGHIRAISAAQPMRVEGGEQYTPLHERQVPRQPSSTVSASQTAPFPVPQERPPEQTQAPPIVEPELPPPPPRSPLERGRVIRISVGPGKVWEAVYWTSDELGPIVAHDTNREWSLMHLDLSRFKDAIEYGEILSEEELKQIEESLARQGTS